MKKTLLMLNILCCLLTLDSYSQETYIKSMYKNRFFIDSLYTKYKPDIKVNGTTILFFRNNCNELLQYTDKPFLDWEKNQVALYGCFHNLISKLYTENSGLILDKKIVKIYIPFLSDNTISLDDRNYMARKLLVYIYRDVLLQEKSLLKKHLQWYIDKPKSTDDTDNFLTLALMCDLLPEEKERLVNVKWYKYKLYRGDTTMVDSILTLYDKLGNNYSQKKMHIRNLMHIGSPYIIQEVLKRFNDPVYHIVRDIRDSLCAKKSIRWVILKELQRHHSDSPLLNEILYDAFEYNHVRDKKYTPKSNLTLDKYLHIFLVWAKQTYNITPNDPTPPFPVMKDGRCLEPHNWGIDMKKVRKKVKEREKKRK